MNQYRQTIVAMYLLALAVGCVAHTFVVMMCALAVDQKGIQAAGKIITLPASLFEVELRSVPTPLFLLAYALTSMLWANAAILTIATPFYLIHRSRRTRDVADSPVEQSSD